MIPRQPDGSDECQHCGEAIRLLNAQQGPEWRHGHNSPWCGEPGTPVTTRAVPAGQPWPEMGPR